MGAEHSPSPSPGRGTYGFTLLLTAAFGAVVFGLWAFLSVPLLNSVGLTYLPHQYWSLAVPLYSLICLVSFQLFLCGLNSSVCFSSLSGQQVVDNDFSDD